MMDYTEYLSDIRLLLQNIQELNTAVLVVVVLIFAFCFAWSIFGLSRK